MRLMTILFLALFFLTSSVKAQEESAVYKVADVIVDVASGNAAKARDQAFAEAQRHAFIMLLDRLGVPEKAAKASDDVVASFIQSIDVQREYASGLRYTGTFTVQFKPEAVRHFLTGRSIKFVEARAKPVVVLPVLKSKDRLILWQETTPWHQAWLEVAKNAGLVPMIIPEGDLDDVTKITPEEALTGNPDKMRTMMQKYGADGVLVPVLEADLEDQAGKIAPKVEVHRFDENGLLQEPHHFDLPPISSPKGEAEILANGAKQVIGQAERAWRQSATAQAQMGPTVYLPVDVPVSSLAAWNKIRQKMKEASQVSGANIVTMTRGLIHAEIEFRGDIPSLKATLATKGLTLQQGASGGWEVYEGGTL